MDEAKFWQLIEAAHQNSNGNMDVKCAEIKKAISQLSSDEANMFSTIFDRMMDKSYSWCLWGAAYLINGGCGDDTFTDFRASLISRGKHEFDQAVANADALNVENFDEDTWFFEGFQYAISEGVQSILGNIPQRVQPHPDEPSGTQWEEDPDELKQRYPNLWVAFEHIWLEPIESETPQIKPWWKFW